MSTAFPAKDAGCFARARILWIVWTLAASSGCLVTDKIEYSEQDLPPHITVLGPPVVQPFPASSQCVTTVGGDAAVDANPRGPWVKFAVDVFDSNVEDELYAWVVLNGKHLLNTGPFDQTIPVNNQAARDSVEFCVSAGDLNLPCNVVDLVVMRQDDSQVNLEYGIDLGNKEKYARTSWLVLGRTNDNPDLCELTVDAGVNP